MKFDIEESIARSLFFLNLSLVPVNSTTKNKKIRTVFTIRVESFKIS